MPDEAARDPNKVSAERYLVVLEISKGKRWRREVAERITLRTKQDTEELEALLGREGGVLAEASSPEQAYQLAEMYRAAGAEVSVENVDSSGGGIPYGRLNRDTPKSLRRSTLRFNFFELLFSLLLLAIAFLSFRYAWTSQQTMREIAALAPLSHAQLSDTAVGEQWLVSGLVHLEGDPEPASEMAIYIFEEHIDNGDSSFWTRLLTHKPELELEVDGKVVRFSGTGYEFAYPHTFVRGENLRFRGFRAGDRVTLLGRTLSPDRSLNVELLSGGSKAALVDHLRGEPFGALILGAGALIGVIMNIFLLRPTKPPRDLQVEGSKVTTAYDRALEARQSGDPNKFL